MREDQEARQVWLERLSALNEENFVDENSGGLDSGLPSLRVPESEDQFPQLASRPGGILPDLEELVEGSASDPQLSRELAAAGIENPHAPRKFHAGEWVVTMQLHRGRFECDAENGETGETQSFSLRAEDSDGAIIAATRYLQRDEPRKLSPEDTIRVQRMAQQDVATALGEYLRLALPERMVAAFEDADDPMELLNTPALQPLFREALLNCWYWHTPAASLSDDFLSYLDEFVGDRVFSFALLDSAWLAFQDHREQSQRARALGLFNSASEESTPAPEQVPDFESMSDEEIARLQRETLLEHARRVRGR